MKNILFGVGVVALALSIFAFIPKHQETLEQKKEKVKWYSWEEAVEASKIEKRKIFVDVYTDWCGWCKRMDQTTFSDPGIVAYLNENFYPIKLNAEQKEAIRYNGHTFKYVPYGRRGYHELAATLLNGKLAYPTVVFMNEDFQIMQRFATYLNVSQFDMIMRYLGEDLNQEISWEAYQKQYKTEKNKPKKHKDEPE